MSTEEHSNKLVQNSLCTGPVTTRMGAIRRQCLIKPQLSHRSDDHILLNDMQPHVATANKILLWMTPFGLCDMRSRSKFLPTHIITRECLVITRAISPKAQGNYAAGLLRFMHFCNDLGITEDLHMPAPEWLLSAFITTRGAGEVGKGTLSAWLLGLQLWHNVNNAPWHGSTHLKRALQGASHAAPSTSKKSKRLPITLWHLQSLRCHLTLTNTFDAAVFAMACVAFWCQCQIAEVCMDGPFNPLRHATRGSLQQGGTTTTGVKFGGFRAPHMKTSPSGQDILWTDSSCPCSA